MMTILRTTSLAALCGLAILLVNRPAEAAFTMTLDDPGTVGVDKTIADNGVGDFEPNNRGDHIHRFHN